MKQFSMTQWIEKRFRIFKGIPYLPILVDEQIKVFTLLFWPKVFRNMMRYVDFIKSIENVSTRYHKYGGLEFSINNKEIGHIHGDGLVDLYLNNKFREELVRKQIVKEHHVLRSSGWISYKICGETDLEEIKKVTQIALDLRLRK